MHFYKNIKQTELKVGIFVVIAFIVLFLSYSWLNDWIMGTRYNKYSIKFETISNLEKGNSVFYRGVRIGKVQDISFGKNGVIVEISVEQGINIESNSIFQIKDTDMMGTKSLDIIAGYGSEYLLSNEVYEGSSLPGFSDLVSNVNRLIDKLDVLINAFGDEDIFVERLDNIIYNADKGLQSMNVLMLDLQKSDLLVAFTELKTASRAIQSLINDNLDKLDGTLDLMTKSFSHLDSLVVRFYSASEKDDNNVGKLLTDDELYTNIVTTTKELEELITDIKKDPKKYFKFSVF